MVQDRVSPADSPCYDWYNYGATGNLRIGTAANGVRHRPLLAFDLRDIPAGASVSQATMTLWYPSSGAPTNSTGRQVDLHRLTRAWTEGSGIWPGQCNGSGADWNETQGGVHWGAGGGDLDSTADAALRPQLTVTYSDGSASIAPRVSLAAPAPGATVSGTAVPLKASCSKTSSLVPWPTLGWRPTR